MARARACVALLALIALAQVATATPTWENGGKMAECRVSRRPGRGGAWRLRPCAAPHGSFRAAARALPPPKGRACAAACGCPFTAGPERAPVKQVAARGRARRRPLTRLTPSPRPPPRPNSHQYYDIRAIRRMMVKENAAVTPAQVQTAITQIATGNNYLCASCNPARMTAVTIAGFPGPYNKLCGKWPSAA
jgi:hypothetical protein